MKPAIDRQLSPHTVPRRLDVAFLSLVLGAAACGGDDSGDGPMMAPPPPPSTNVAYQASDPCAANTPTPSDLFFDASGKNEAVSCPLPMDPLDAAVELVERDQRAPLSSQVLIPIAGDLDFDTLSSTVTFSFTPGQGSPEGLPPVLLIEFVGTSTRVVEADIREASGSISVQPTSELFPARRYAVVATKALEDSDGLALEPSDEVEALLGTDGVEANAFEGLDAETAARLERMRQAVQPVLTALGQGSPPVTRDDIVSIHTFTTRAGNELYPTVVAQYDAAVARGTYGYSIEVEEANIAPTEIYGANVPVTAFENVGSFIRGWVNVPRFLGDDVRFRANWDTNPEITKIPFLMSIPRQGMTYPVALHVVGFGRSRLDARALANSIGGGPRAAVLAIELRCHGDRSPGADGICQDNRTTAEAATLTDQLSNNGNPEFNGPDGIPDASGVGFFPGDPRQLRDSQLAATLEIMHVLASLRDGAAFTEMSIPVDRQRIHVLAHGYNALPAAAAAAYIATNRRARTIQFLAGGASLSELILNGGAAQREAFNMTLPGGIGGAQAATLLTRVREYLAPIELPIFVDVLRERFRSGASPRRILLPHPSQGQQGVTQYVSEAARNALGRMDGLDLPSRQISQHLARCDNYFVYTCRLGDNPAILEAATDQIAGFLNSDGVTIPDPAQ